MEIVYRLIPCDGLCGGYIKVPHTIARQIMKPNGTIIRHDALFCQDCSIWLLESLEFQVAVYLEAHPL